MAKETYNADSRRRVLQAFIDRNKLKVQTWTNASDLSEAGLRAFLAGRADSMSDRTYARLAAGATKLLERNVTAAMLRGDLPPEIEIEIKHVIGAGDEVHIVEGDSGFEYTSAPPGFEQAGAGVVRGDSMRPIFESGDVLFWRHVGTPPVDPPKRAVIVKVKDGALFVKRLLPGTKRGRFHLLSVNPINPIMDDQPVESIAQIEWVKPRLM
jgi:phage repressor protein C with HTH and peptisase S24 domain